MSNDYRQYQAVYHDYDNEIYHFGILGMKWGVRRYQNLDGSLTEAGKRRYSRMSYDLVDHGARVGNLTNRGVIRGRDGLYRPTAIEAIMDELPKIASRGNMNNSPINKAFCDSVIEVINEKTFSSDDPLRAYNGGIEGFYNYDVTDLSKLIDQKFEQKMKNLGKG